MTEIPKRHRVESRKLLRSRGIPIRFAIITVSTSRHRAIREGEPTQDRSGDIAEHTVRSSGFDVGYRAIIPDDRQAIVDALREAQSAACNIIIFIGGTGISRDDITPDVLEGLVDRKIEGFGELFRVLSYQEVGSAAMLTRAMAGICGKTLIFAVPGSPNAVRLALEKLIIPEVEYMIYLISR